MADRFTLQSGSGILELQSSTDDLLLQSDAGGAASNPSTARRSALMTGVVAAAWSLVVATPLFATVGLQTQIDRPPVRLEDERQAVVRTWEPTTWNAQRVKFAPDRSVAAPASVPFVRQSFVDRWTPLDWPAQTSHKTYIPDAKAPWSRVPSAPIAIWSQDEWPTQQTRKVSTTGPELFPMPHTDAGQRSISQWPQDEWPTRVTRKATTTGPEVYPVSRTQWGQDIVRSWPQAEWDSQAARKTPIPDAIVAPEQVPFVRQQLLGHWLQLEWESQQTRKSPIPTVVVAGDAPPIRTVSFPIYDRWYDVTVLPAFQAAGYQDGPTVGSADNPPPRHPAIEHVYSQWEPRPLQAVWFNRAIDLSALIPSTRDTFYAVASTWIEPDYPQPRRARVTESGPAVVYQQAFNGQSAQPIDQWTQPQWDTQITRKVSTSGPEVAPPEPPVIEPPTGGGRWRDYDYGKGKKKKDRDLRKELFDAIEASIREQMYPHEIAEAEPAPVVTVPQEDWTKLREYAADNAVLSARLAKLKQDLDRYEAEQQALNDDDEDFWMIS